MGNRNLPEQQAFTYPDQRYQRQPKQPQQVQQSIAVKHEKRPVRNLSRQQYSPPQDSATPYSTGYEIEVGEPDEPYYTRSHTSIRRYDQPQTFVQGNTRFEYHGDQVIHTAIPPRRSKQAQPVSQFTDDAISPSQIKPNRRIHWLAIAGIGAVIAIVLVAGGMWIGNKWNDTLNDWTYTSTFRTFSVDQAVGHNRDSAIHPSHFIVQNDKRRIVIIEFPADNPAKVIIYYGPMLLGDGQDKTPITLSFQTDPQTGRVDMLVYVEDQTYLFTNTGTKFVEPAGA